ncbi:MAG: exonuclease SbcCD subunit D [Bacilli bacterium]
MRFIHTADWHLGRILHEYSLIDDQKFWFEKFLDFVKEEKPEAIILAGDIYDRSIPPTEAVELFDHLLFTITQILHIPIYAISGNHDSTERIRYGSRLFSQSGVHIAGDLKDGVKSVAHEDEWGTVHVHLVPYADPAYVRALYKEDCIRTHDDAFAAILAKHEQQFTQEGRHILVAHGYFTYYMDKKETHGDLTLSESERPLAIGGADLIDAERVDHFNYVALGHLHAPQKVGNNHIRYSGTPLKYSIGEAKQRKGFEVVTMDGDGAIETEHITLPVKRDVVVIRNTLQALLEKERTEDYVYIELTDEGELIDPMNQLRAVYQNALGMRRVNDKTMLNEEIKTQASGNWKQMTVPELFATFYASINDKEISAQQKKWIDEVYEEMKVGES